MMLLVLSLIALSNAELFSRSKFCSAKGITCQSTTTCKGTALCALGYRCQDAKCVPAAVSGEACTKKGAKVLGVTLDTFFLCDPDTLTWKAVAAVGATCDPPSIPCGSDATCVDSVCLTKKEVARQEPRGKVIGASCKKSAECYPSSIFIATCIDDKCAPYFASEEKGGSCREGFHCGDGLGCQKGIISANRCADHEDNDQLTLTETDSTRLGFELYMCVRHVGGIDNFNDIIGSQCMPLYAVVAQRISAYKYSWNWCCDTAVGLGKTMTPEEAVHIARLDFAGETEGNFRDNAGDGKLTTTACTNMLATGLAVGAIAAIV